ncbi:MAG: ferredoxin [Firmicutes bacterium ADurb.Bin182]|nr:MAG: ferredoxin [Firmicutes bacterium ADurb.Bin182]
MEKIKLGNTGIEVSRLCFGTLTMGPLQRNLPLNEGAALLERAFSLGVNFLDTAEIYGTYPYVNKALTIKRDVVVCTKSYAYDAATAEESWRKAVKGIGREFIDIFLLHEQESEHTLRGHREAIEFYLKKQRQGYIGAFGVSTHFIRCVQASLKYPEIQVIFPLINLSGVGIADGTTDQMLGAIKSASDLGKGIIAMKPLGGGHLIGRREHALKFILGLDCVHTIAIGMQSIAEVNYNCAVFSGRLPDESDAGLIRNQKRELLIQSWCEGCGTCVSVCKSGAIGLENGKAKVDPDKCVFCGYCAGRCPQFCIKVI